MENKGFNKEYLKVFKIGDWSASCTGKTFQLNNDGIKLFVRGDEGLEKIIFDTEKKKVSVVVKNPTLSKKIPRNVDLSSAVDFFDELRNNIEKILTTKWASFASVIPNDDRTIFEIS